MKNHTPLIIFDPQVLRLPAAFGDCACADNWPVPQTRPSAPPDNPAARYRCAPAVYRRPLNEAYTFLFDLLTDAPGAVLNEPALAVLDAFAAGDGKPAPEGPAAAAAWRTLVALGLLRPLDAPSLAPAPPSALTAWLHVSDQCNLQCAYCYLPRSGKNMSAEIGAAAVAAVFRSARRHGFPAVKLKYAGGEASLNFERILALQAQAVELARTYALALEGVVLTNGVGWTPRMLAELKARAMPVMVSLDGIGPAHDAQRTFAGGRGSFDRVAHTLDQLIAMGHPPQISITLTNRNLAGLAETVEWLLDRDLHFSLNFYRETECSAAFPDLRLSDERLIEEMRRAYAVIARRVPRFSLLGSLLDRTHFAARHDNACGAGRHYLVIGPEGRVAQCQMNITHAVTDVFADDPLGPIRANVSGLNIVPVAAKPGCRACLWRYGCAGGCPLETFRRTGRWDAPSPYCSVYQTLFPEVLRLEGLRLLKYYAAAGELARALDE